MLLLTTKDLQIKYILTSRCAVCGGEAVALLMAVLQPLPSTNEVNSFVTPRRRSCDSRGDCCPLQLIGGWQTRRSNEGQCWRGSGWLALAVGRPLWWKKGVD